MSETLRDLVVSLSLQTDNFTRNIKSVNKQIAEAESKFRLAAAGVEGFERTTTGRRDTWGRRGAGLPGRAWPAGAHGAGRGTRGRRGRGAAGARGAAGGAGPPTKTRYYLCA